MDSTTVQSADIAQYAPSWFDRFTDWIERLPGPGWISYAILGALSAGAFIAVQISQGTYEETAFYPWHIFLGLQPLIPLALMHYLDVAAVKALDRFKPAMSKNGMTLSAARSLMTTMPARPALISTVAGVVFFFIIFNPTTTANSLPNFKINPSPISMASVMVNFLMMWSFYGLLIYHTIHQIAVIRNIFAKHTEADLFDQEPLYAFSTITGLTAIVLLLNSYGWMLGLLQGNAVATNPVSTLGVNLFFAAFSLFLFVWPLWGAHQLLVEAKQNALSANADHMRSVVNEIHNKVQSKDVQAMDDWHKALSALELERNRIDSLPTWPWRPEALRGLIVAFVIPVLVWVLQYLLERFLV
jgi:hypothetical protein